MTPQQSTTPTMTASPGNEGITAERLSDDKVFHLLQNQRRRDVIRYLSDAEDTVSMRDIAEQVAAWEHDTSVAALSSDERQRVYIPLYQNHLPKLDDEGVIEYNQSRGTVKRTSTADQLEQYLTDEGDDSAALPPGDPVQSGEQDAWTDAYLGATGLSGVFLLFALFGAPLVSPVSDLLFASLMLVTFATVTCLHALFGGRASVSA